MFCDMWNDDEWWHVIINDDENDDEYDDEWCFTSSVRNVYECFNSVLSVSHSSLATLHVQNSACEVPMRWKRMGVMHWTCTEADRWDCRLCCQRQCGWSRPYLMVKLRNARSVLCSFKEWKTIKKQILECLHRNDLGWVWVVSESLRKKQESLWTWRHLPRKAGWFTVCQGLNPGVGYLSMTLEQSGDKIHQNTAVSQCWFIYIHARTKQY